MKQNKKFIPYTTDKEFVDWLKKCDANMIFLPYLLMCRKVAASL